MHTKTNSMKRYGDLYEKICSLDNLRLAHQNAKKGKGWYQEVKMIDKDPDRWLKEVQTMLVLHTFRTSEYQVFYKREGKKNRKIYKLPYFPDRIVQWAVLQVIDEYLIKNLTDDTYSAIPGRGINLALTRLQNAMWYDVENCQFCLKIDARHYYQSIDRDILKQKYRRLFKDAELLSVLDEIIDSIDTADLDDLLRLEATPIDHKGLPIGNYHSQYGGNFYFSSFDHWIKEVKHIKHYFRYMDDIVIFAKTKEELHDLFKGVQEYFKVNLKLTIKDNWQIFPSYERGIDFLGYRTFLGYSILRKSTCEEMKRKMTRIRKKCESGQMMNYSEYCAVNSYSGWMKPCSSFRLKQKYIEPLLPYCERYYETNIKRKAA